MNGKSKMNRAIAFGLSVIFAGLLQGCLVETADSDNDPDDPVANAQQASTVEDLELARSRRADDERLSRESSEPPPQPWVRPPSDLSLTARCPSGSESTAPNSPVDTEPPANPWRDEEPEESADLASPPAASPEATPTHVVTPGEFKTAQGVSWHKKPEPPPNPWKPLRSLKKILD